MATSVLMPALSPTMEEGVIVRWCKKENELVKEDDVLFEVETDKATLEYKAGFDEVGYLRKIIIPEQGSVLVGQPVAIVTATADEPFTSDEAPEKKEMPKAEVSSKPQSATQPTGRSLIEPSFIPTPPLDHLFYQESRKSFKASPLAKKLAKKKGLDISSVQGSGPGGRVIAKDLDKAAEISLASSPDNMEHVCAGAYDEEPLSSIRKTIGKRLQESKMWIPHFYVSQEVSMTKLLGLKNDLKEIGQKFTINDFILRAVALTLRACPSLNAAYNSETQSIVRFKTVDLSLAVAFENGLITPIVRFADQKPLSVLSAEVKELTSAARSGNLKPEQFHGGGFTVSNLGMFGISEFYAIINPPQAAILAISGIEEKPVVENGNILIGKRMKVTLSVDHRIVDGADAAKFIKKLQEVLENPAVLLL